MPLSDYDRSSEGPVFSGAMQEHMQKHADDSQQVFEEKVHDYPELLTPHEITVAFEERKTRGYVQAVLPDIVCLLDDAQLCALVACYADTQTSFEKACSIVQETDARTFRVLIASRSCRRAIARVLPFILSDRAPGEIAEAIQHPELLAVLMMTLYERPDFLPSLGRDHLWALLDHPDALHILTPLIARDFERFQDPLMRSFLWHHPHLQDFLRAEISSYSDATRAWIAHT